MQVSLLQKIKDAPFWERIAENNLYSMLNEMMYTKEWGNKFQRNRTFEAVAVFVLFMLFGYIFDSTFYIVGVIASVMLYRSKFNKVVHAYQMWKFNRHLQFTKFIRLLIPYLIKSKGKVSLYTIFNRMLLRIENETDRNSLFLLMSEMGNRPNNIQPFIEYAERSSGTDESIDFMSMIFDFQQNPHDADVIVELGKASSKEMLRSIDEIIHLKLQKFNSIPTKIVMTAFLLFIGFFIAFAWDLAISMF